MSMKINIAYPQYGAQKMLELEDEKQIRIFFDRRISEEIPADMLGDEFKGYVFKITGGFDKDGFAMKQGILVNHRVKIVLDGSTGHYRPKRPGCRKRKSVRGCIVGPDISCVNVVIVKKGPAELPGLTNPDAMRPSLRGPKRANNIRKLWGLGKDDDVRQYVSRKKLPATEKYKKERFKSPKIQRLITPQMLQRKRRRIALKRRRYAKAQKDASEYHKLLNQLRKEKRQALLSKKRKSTVSTKKSEGATTDKASKSEKSTSTKETGKRRKPAEEKEKAKVAPAKGAVEKKKAGEKKQTTKGKADTTKGKGAKQTKDTTKAPKDQSKKQGGQQKKGDAPKPAAPKQDQPKASPKQDQPKAAPPKQDQPKASPKQDQPKSQGGQQKGGQGNKGQQKGGQQKGKGQQKQ